MFRHTIALAALLTIFVFTGVCFAGQADSINEAIEDLGYQWVAGETDVSWLHNELGWYTPGPAESEDFGDDIILYSPTGKDVPAKWDWRDVDGQNWVPRVKNQLSCGSCWAFATTGPIEVAVAYAEDWPDPEIDLSEQQMLSCSNAGRCDTGGLTNSSFNYAQKTGLTVEDCLKYQAKDRSEGATCDQMCDDWQSTLFKIDNWRAVTLTGFNIQAMKEALLEGPIAASMVIYEDFFYYESGVYKNTTLKWQGNHAVTIIGWDDTQGNGHWIAKNSWGTGWGEKGYFRIGYNTAFIGAMSILPSYTSQGLGPWGDDDDDEADDDDGPTADDDDQPDDDDDTDSDVEPQSDDDDDDGGSCSG